MSDFDLNILNSLIREIPPKSNLWILAKSNQAKQNLWSAEKGSGKQGGNQEYRTSD